MELHGQWGSNINSMNSADLVPVDAVPDGVLLSEWAEQNAVKRSTSFALIRIIKTLGLEPERVRQKGASKPSPFLSGQVLEAMNSLLQEFNNGKSIAQLEAEHSTSIVAAQSSMPAAPENDPTINPSSLSSRLQAADLAIKTGLPLTRNEITWILGASPTTDFAMAAPVRIEKRSSRGWALLPPDDN
jgi:hypothetical protein